MTRHGSIAILALVVTCQGISGCSSSEDPSTQTGASATDSEGDADAGRSGSAADRASTGQSAKKPESDPLRPVVDIETTLGTIQVELDAETAPGTVANFLNYVNSAHYIGTIFHYVDGDSMILGGGYTEELEAKEAAPPIRNEAHNGLKNVAGTIAMSRHYESIDSATCQFFINLKDNPELDFTGDTPEEYGYCVFGKVTAGMDIVERIGHAAVQDAGDFVSTPAERIVIKQVRMVR